MSVQLDVLDRYIEATADALDLRIEEAWKPSVRSNLEVTLKFARLVEEFTLPDELEPAEIYES